MLINMKDEKITYLLPNVPYLVMIDMDSTLIQNEVIDDLATANGVGSEVKEITEMAMAGKLDFAESLRRRVNLLQGADSKILNDVKNSISLTPGAKELIQKFKSLDYKICVVSGGFDVVIGDVVRELGIEEYRANHLEIESGKLTGKLLGSILDAQGKKNALIQLATENSIPLEHTIAIGDGANDIPMIKQAAIGIAFNAKEALQNEADLIVNSKSLLGVLDALGLSNP